MTEISSIDWGIINQSIANKAQEILNSPVNASKVVTTSSLRFVTDSDLGKLSSLSGINTGDQVDITGNAATVSTINGRISAGAGVSLSGEGNPSSPYVVSVSDTPTRITITGSYTLTPPSSPVDFQRAKYWIVASGANRALTLDASIIVPTSSAFTSPVTIVNGKKAKVLIEYDASKAQWELTSFINGF